MFFTWRSWHKLARLADPGATGASLPAPARIDARFINSRYYSDHTTVFQSFDYVAPWSTLRALEGFEGNPCAALCLSYLPSSPSFPAVRRRLHLPGRSDAPGMSYRYRSRAQGRWAWVLARPIDTLYSVYVSSVYLRAEWIGSKECARLPECIILAHFWRQNRFWRGGGHYAASCYSGELAIVGGAATRDREFLSAWFWWTTLSFNLGPFSQSRRGLLERYGRIGKSASQVKRCFLVDRDASIRAVLVASDINGQRNGAQRSLKITVTSQRSVPVRRRQKQERWSSRSVANDVTRRAMGRGWVMIAAVIASDVARDVRATTVTVIDYDPVPVVGGPVAYASESSDAQFKLKQGADRRPGSGLEQKLRRCPLTLVNLGSDPPTAF
ncbi:hypothetical protein DFH06DRAFT_1369016 [Mycena polygramma]|nr:hypothetical protein DFH06DRAFT_1369016 [Mycena polygramma]